MNEPVPIRPAYENGDVTNLQSEATELAELLIRHRAGYTIVAGTDARTNERLCAEIADAVLSSRIGGLHQVGYKVRKPIVDARDPSERRPDDPVSAHPQIRRVPTRPGRDLAPWSQEIQALRPAIVLGGEIGHTRMARVRALLAGDAPVLLTAGVAGHAAALALMRDTADAHGHPIDLDTVHHTVQAVKATTPCEACSGFWVQIRRHRLVDQYGEELVHAVETHFNPEERAWIRTWSRLAHCASCANLPMHNVVKSIRRWTPPLHERLRREDPAALDRDLVQENTGHACIASDALLKVVFAEACPDVLAHPQIAGDLAHATLDHGLIQNIQYAR